MSGILVKKLITFIVLMIVTYLKKRKQTMDDDYLEIHAKEMAQAEYLRHNAKCIQKINDAKPQVKDEYTQGVQDGLDWAIRILEKDKSAY